MSVDIGGGLEIGVSLTYTNVRCINSSFGRFCFMDRRAFLKSSTAMAGATLSGQFLEPFTTAVEQAAKTNATNSYDDELFYDDFSKFPVGLLSHPLGQLNGAIQEAHYLSNRGVSLWPWENPICYLDAWVISDEDSKPYIEQHTVNDLAALMHPALITGDPEWKDYSVEVKLRPLSLAEMAGVVFRYHTNR